MIYDLKKKEVLRCKVNIHPQCKKYQAISTNYYLVTTSTEILRSVNF